MRVWAWYAWEARQAGIVGAEVVVCADRLHDALVAAGLKSHQASLWALTRHAEAIAAAIAGDNARSDIGRAKAALVQALAALDGAA